MRELLEEALEYLSKHGTNLDLEKRIEHALAQQNRLAGINRYDFIQPDNWDGYERRAYMEECADGDYVLFDDVEVIFQPTTWWNLFDTDEISEIGRDIFGDNYWFKSELDLIGFARAIERRVRGEDEH